MAQRNSGPTPRYDATTRTWWFVVDVPGDDGKRRQVKRRGFRTREECLEELALVLTRGNQGQLAKPQRKATTLSEFVDEYLKGVEISRRPGTHADYQSRLGRVTRRLGDRSLRSLTAGDFVDLYAWLARAGRVDGGPLAANTVHITHKILKRALDKAVKPYRYIDYNPLQDVDAPPPEEPEHETWTLAEANQFLDYVQDHRLYALWFLLLTTGMRRGEFAGLRWEDLELDAAVPYLAVRRQRTLLRGKVIEQAPKSKAGERVIELDSREVAALRSHRTQQLRERLKQGVKWTDSGYVFTGLHGTPLNPRMVWLTFCRLAEKAGVPRIQFHEGRHTSATLALAAGIDAKIIQVRFGHARIDITLDIYTHVKEGMQVEATRKMNDMLGQRRPKREGAGG